MPGIRDYLELKIQSKTGINSAVIGGAIVTILACSIAMVFALVFLFVWLADRYSPMAAALVLTGAAMCLAIVSAVLTLGAHKRVVAVAEQGLLKNSALSVVQPAYLKTAIQVGNAVGWKKLIPLVGVGLIAAGVAKEWNGKKGGGADARDKGEGADARDDA